jgi:cell division septation protein DedD
MADRNSSAITDSPDREFEIVLGNKQLFSLLFIVFVLLGVFFAMGYLMGRNTLPVDTAAAGSKAPASALSDYPGSGRPSAVAPSVETSSPTQPTTSPEPSASTRSAPVETSPTPVPAVERSKPVAEPTPSSLTVVEPKVGQTFLQVSAITRPEAELLVEVLQKKGFKAILAPGPKENIFRVLVGPEKDDTEMAKTRTALETSGFKPIPRRY